MRAQSMNVVDGAAKTTLLITTYYYYDLLLNKVCVSINVPVLAKLTFGNFGGKNDLTKRTNDNYY